MVVALSLILKEGIKKGNTASIREAATAFPDAQINVTGPGGILSDLFKVFGAIDTQLLGITALVVAVIGLLDLDDVGTRVTEHHRAVRTGEVLGQIQHSHAI